MPVMQSPSRNRSPTTIAYGVAAAALGIVATVVVLWLLASEHIELMVLALILEFAAIYFVKVLWRRGRKHAAIDAHAALLNDPRRPILFLRSFQDDPHMLGPRMGPFRAHQVPRLRASPAGGSDWSPVDERRPA
jgi:hypothetical protein